MYKTEDLCIQNVFELAIIEKAGLFTYKCLNIYEKNISYNEMPLLPYDKDNNSSLYYNDSESTTGISQVRDSLLSYQIMKKQGLIPPNVQISKISKSGPGLSDIGLKLGSRDSLLTKCIVFEESDDSLDDN